jgi:hypothetical protein
MPEGSYTFELVNWDDKGNRSVSVTIAAEIVGDRYRSSFRNRQIPIPIPIPTLNLILNPIASMLCLVMTSMLFFCEDNKILSIK